MATCNYIPESKQIPSVMKVVIDYVSREAKTVDEDGIRYLSGVNCAGTMAFDEFMATKNLFGKRDGWCFYHYEQSFAPGEITSYRKAHEIGIELAKELFPHHEVLVGTHLDAYTETGEQRVHNHFVINSVSFEDGKKLHTGPRALETMRKISDRICAEHQLSVLPEYKQKYGSKPVGTREYRATIKGDGWKFAAINDIETAMTIAGTKQDFISLMELAGYAVNWSNTRKYITYTCPNGMKVRDIRLHENKFLRENMGHEFRIRQQYLKEAITFQPTLHEQISALMTKAELEDTLETTTSALSKWSRQFSDEVIDSTESIVPRVSHLLSETERELSRDGRMREEFLKNIKEEEDERISYFEDLMKKLNRKILFFLIGTASGSALFSVLICLLMR